MKSILFAALALSLSGCDLSNDYHVTAFKTVTGEEASPWPTGCLATIENRTQRIVGLFGLPCERIQIGDVGKIVNPEDCISFVTEHCLDVHAAQSR